MTFRDWVDSNGGMGCRAENALWLSIQHALGVSYSGQRKWYVGSARPTIEHILLLDEFTQGEVTLKDWLHDRR